MTGLVAVTAQRAFPAPTRQDLAFCGRVAYSAVLLSSTDMGLSAFIGSFSSHWSYQFLLLQLVQNSPGTPSKEAGITQELFGGVRTRTVGGHHPLICTVRQIGVMRRATCQSRPRVLKQHQPCVLAVVSQRSAHELPTASALLSLDLYPQFPPACLRGPFVPSRLGR